MSAPQHTPGPWMPHHDKGRLYVETHRDDVICMVARGLGTPEDQANARLIAAAPEMLAALNEIAAWGDGEVGPHMDEPGAACIARAAITKATGSAK